MDFMEVPHALDEPSVKATSATMWFGFIGDSRPLVYPRSPNINSWLRASWVRFLEGLRAELTGRRCIWRSCSEHTDA